MKRIWNRIMNWLTRPQRETMEYIFELGRTTGWCECEIEHINKNLDRAEERSKQDAM
jgi:hypothetical protein